MAAVQEEFGLGGVVPLLKGAAQVEGGNIGKLLIAQILLFLLAQLGEGGTGNRDSDALAVHPKDAVDGIAMPGGDGGEQMNKPNLHRFGERQRTYLKGRNNVTHNVICPDDRI